jgi:apolipoprotein N-acyltransferase
MFVISFGGDGGMDSLANLKVSFQRDEVLILGWVHYLVFDLFIGSWISRDAQKNAFSHLAIVPVLILTLFAGPIGLLLYLLFRAIRLKKVTF